LHNEENGHGKGMVGEDDEESFVVCMALMERLSHDIVLKNALFTHTSRRVNRSSEITQLLAVLYYYFIGSVPTY
jgi:hypothetical protein